MNIEKEVGGRFVKSRCYGNLGLAYYSLGNFRKSIEYYEKSLKYLEKLFQINHRIEKREITLPQFLKLAENLFLGETKKQKKRLVDFLTENFLGTVNYLKISPRNLKRILMKAEEICGHLPPKYHGGVHYAFAFTVYALLELCAPEFIVIFF